MASNTKYLHILKTKKMANGPYAIAYDNNLGTVFIENACPGDEVEATVYDQRKGFSYAHIDSLIKASELRDPNPPCKLHKICGSCQWQHIDYSEQLKFKKQNLIDLINKSQIDTSYLLSLRGTECRSNLNNAIPDLIGMDTPWNYRNKIIYPVDTVPSTGRLLAGYYKRNSNELINIKYCPIQYSIFDEIMALAKDLCSEYGINKQILRHILMRSNIDSSEILVSFIMRKNNFTAEDRDHIQNVAQILQGQFSQIKVISINYNDLSTNVILGNETELLNERSHILEDFGGIQLQISTTSFFQVNHSQFLKIIKLIQNHIKDGSKVLDAYCGIGTISLSLAQAFKHLEITGIEELAAAIEDAKANAKLNNLDQVNFIRTKMEDANLANHDTVIVNPPRKGCSNKVLDAIAKSNSLQIIYVSCNPATLCRDIKYLEQFGYRLNFIQGVDMFPHSFHFETLATLEKTSKL